MNLYYTTALPRAELIRAAFARERCALGERDWLRDGGKPHFPDPMSPKFNLTHTGAFIAMAVGRQEVGVDAERMSPRRAEAVQRRLLPAERDENFAELWTAKEAYVKFRGGTLSAMLPALRYERGTLYEDGTPVDSTLWHRVIGDYLVCVCTQFPEEIAVCEIPPRT